MLIKKQKVEVMDKSKIEKVQPEQVQNSEQKADDNSVSPAFANALVVGSQSFVTTEVGIDCARQLNCKGIFSVNIRDANLDNTYNPEVRAVYRKRND